MMDLPGHVIRSAEKRDDDAAALWRLLRGRHSCRAFRVETVKRSIIKSILASAQHSPSWCNMQPWRVVVVSGAALDTFRAALLDHVAASDAAPDIEFPQDYRGVYRERRRACGLRLYEAVGVEPGDRAASGRQSRENFRFFGAPHVAIVTIDAALGQYGAIDCGAYVSTFMLARRRGVSLALRKRHLLRVHRSYASGSIFPMSDSWSVAFHSVSRTLSIRPTNFARRALTSEKSSNGAPKHLRLLDTVCAKENVERQGVRECHNVCARRHDVRKYRDVCTDRRSSN